MAEEKPMGSGLKNRYLREIAALTMMLFAMAVLRK
jgi:hypothetical protein